MICLNILSLGWFEIMAILIVHKDCWYWILWLIFPVVWTIYLPLWSKLWSIVFLQLFILITADLSSLTDCGVSPWFYVTNIIFFCF